jgi:hypothetical protein
LGKGKYTFWVRWNHIAMGLRPSLFCAAQIMAWLDETFFGEHMDQDNVFRWDVVELNPPDMPQYSPAKPWVYKKHYTDGRIAADVLTYIDVPALLDPVRMNSGRQLKNTLAAATVMESRMPQGIACHPP